jgi:hypothetical protein
MYDEGELESIRRAISRPGVPAAEKGLERDSVPGGARPARLALFWSLAATEPPLFEKLGRDPLLETYSIYGFFPEVFQRVYQNGSRPEISFAGRARGRVAILSSPGGGLVVKPVQSAREAEVAGIAGEVGAGPRQYPSLPGFITEELVQGVFFTQLATEDVDDGSMYRLGGGLGRILARLHSRQVYYNDASLSDPSGRSHLIVEPGGACRLIDFGISLLLDRHPAMGRQETYNFVRTLPLYRVLVRMGLAGGEMDRFLEEYAMQLGRTSREEIMSRDVRFAEEGLAMAARRMGKRIVEPFRKGFDDAYRS